MQFQLLPEISCSRELTIHQSQIKLKEFSILSKYSSKNSIDNTEI